MRQNANVCVIDPQLCVIGSTELSTPSSLRGYVSVVLSSATKPVHNILSEHRTQEVISARVVRSAVYNQRLKYKKTKQKKTALPHYFYTFSTVCVSTSDARTLCVCVCVCVCVRARARACVASFIAKHSAFPLCVVELVL